MLQVQRFLGASATMSKLSIKINCGDQEDEDEEELEGEKVPKKVVIKEDIDF